MAQFNRNQIDEKIDSSSKTSIFRPWNHIPAYIIIGVLLLAFASRSDHGATVIALAVIILFVSIWIDRQKQLFSRNKRKAKAPHGDIRFAATALHSGTKERSIEPNQNTNQFVNPKIPMPKKINDAPKDPLCSETELQATEFPFRTISGITFPVATNLSPKQINTYSKNKLLWIRDYPDRAAQWETLKIHSGLLKNGVVEGIETSGVWVYDVLPEKHAAINANYDGQKYCKDSLDTSEVPRQSESTISFQGTGSTPYYANTDQSKNFESSNKDERLSEELAASADYRLAISGLSKLEKIVCDLAYDVLSNLYKDSLEKGLDSGSSYLDTKALYDCCIIIAGSDEEGQALAELLEQHREVLEVRLHNFLNNETENGALVKNDLDEYSIDNKTIQGLVARCDVAVHESGELSEKVKMSECDKERKSYSNHLPDTPAVIIRLGKTYKPGMTKAELYEACRGNWAISLRRAKNAKTAYIAHKGRIVGVFSIRGWQETNELAGNGSFRIRFYGEPSEGDSHLIGLDISDIFKAGESSPVKYVNC